MTVEGPEVSGGERDAGAAGGAAGGTLGSAGDGPAEGRVGRRAVLYPNAYVWYVFAGCLDLMLTNTVMVYFGAREVNALAARTIDRFGFAGLIALKFSTVVLVLVVCEVVGRRKVEVGRRLSEWAVALSSVPVVVTLAQVAMLMIAARGRGG